MDVIFLIGRILYVSLFFTSGIFNHLRGKGGVEYSRSMGAPAPDVLVPLSGVVIVIGSVMIVLGVWADLAALALAVFLIPISYYMHAYWRLDDPMEQQSQQVQFLKNVGLLGGALILFYVYNQLQGEAGLSLTDPLFGRG